MMKGNTGCGMQNSLRTTPASYFLEPRSVLVILLHFLFLFTYIDTSIMYVNIYSRNYFNRKYRIIHYLIFLKSFDIDILSWWGKYSSKNANKKQNFRNHTIH